MDFRVTDTITPQDEETLRQGLLAYNLDRLEDTESKDLGIFYEDASGQMQAGLTGHTHGLWLFVKYLWVDEALRGQHIGGALLQQAEETASQRGCRHVFLDTFSFQAPDFYRKKGYREVFTLEAYPVTGKRYYFVKDIQPA